MLVNSFAASALDQALEPYVSAEAMVSLLGGSITQAGLPQVKLDLPALNSGLLPTLRGAGQLLLATSWRGFSGFLFRVPIASDSDDAGSVQLEFRIRDYTWKLTGLDLSQKALDQIRKAVVRREAS